MVGWLSVSLIELFDATYNFGGREIAMKVDLAQTGWLNGELFEANALFSIKSISGHVWLSFFVGLFHPRNAGNSKKMENMAIEYKAPHSIRCHFVRFAIHSTRQSGKYCNLSNLMLIYWRDLLWELKRVLSEVRRTNNNKDVLTSDGIVWQGNLYFISGITTVQVIKFYCFNNLS